jgi:hypothetical protein
MAVKTTLAQLEEVQTAITALMTGAQSYTLDGSHTVTRANLSALQAREDVLLRRYLSEQGTRPRVSIGQFGGVASE